MQSAYHIRGVLNNPFSHVLPGAAGVVWLVILAVFVAFGIAVFRAYGRARRNALFWWAGSHGFTFSAAPDEGFALRHSDFACLRRTSDHHAYNVLTGKWRGRDCVMFDYSYSLGEQGSSVGHTFSGVLLSSRVPLKPLVIRPAHMADALIEMAGFETIQFESNEFSRRFVVRSPDRRWASDALNPRALQLLLDSPPFIIQFGLVEALAFREVPMRTADFEAAANLLAGLFDLLPSYLANPPSASG